MSHVNRIIFATILCLSLSWVTLKAQQPPELTLQLTPERTEFLLGEPLTIQLEVNHPAGTTIFVPELERWGDLRVREQSRLQTQTQADGGEITTQTLLVSRFQVGEFATQPLTVTARGADGQLQELYAPPISLTVRATITDMVEATLADIRPQATLPEPFFTTRRAIQVGAAVAGLLALLALAAWAWRRPRAPHVEPTYVDPRLPHEFAFDELDRIERLGLPQRGEFKPHYIALSDCMREYLYRRYQIPALDLTTTEIKQQLTQTDLAREHQLTLLRLLQEFDMGKYAEFRPTLEEAISLIDASRRVVETSRQVEATASLPPNES